VVELHFIYVVLYASVAASTLVSTLIVWRRRTARGARSLAVLMLGVAIWSGAYAVMWYVPTLGQQVFWERATDLGSWMVPVAFLSLAFTVAGLDRWRTPGRIALIAIASFALTNIEWLNPAHLYDEAFVAQKVGPYTHFAFVPGPLYWADVVFAYGMVVVALVILARLYLRSSGTERTQAAVLLIGALVPFVAGIGTVSGLVPAGGLDLTPLAFVATGGLWLLAILRSTLLDILPLARDVLVGQMLDGVVVVDGEDHVVDANPTALTMLHTPLTKVLGTSAKAVLSSVKGATAVLGGSGPRRAVLPIGPDGDARYVELGITPLVAMHGRPPAQLVTLHDVTEERRTTEGLLLARQVFDTANEAIVVTLLSSDQPVIDVNDAFCRLTGRSRDDTVGKDIRSFRSDRHPVEFYKAIEEGLFDTGRWQGEVWQTRTDGTEFPSWLSLSVTEDDQENVRHIVRVFTDITEIREAEEQIRHNATHDPLTGLPNRFLLDDRLEHDLAEARRVGGGLAVLLLDLDDLKNINDTLGHAQGDLLLVEVAERIAKVLRESDSVGRVAGDEYAIILTDVKDPVQVESTARRLLEAVASPCRLGAEDVHVTASIGVALFPTDGVDATSLNQHADLAMQGAKRLGRDKIQFFSEDLQESIDRRMIVEKELWGADEEERYFLLYQPQVDLVTGRIAGVEALVRVRSRDGTVLSPAEFIPVAEGSGLIFQLGRWVLRTACTELAVLHEVAPDLIMSVNLSAREFNEIDVTSLHEVLRICGVEERYVELEITETAFLADPQEAAARLESLRGTAGLRLSLDDFGTGYSSLSYVHMFHPDTIKIDQSFVRPLPDDPEAQTIVLSTIALAKGLHATVIAEGPETEEQVRFLRANGCDRAQGFYFSRPVPPDELTLLLRGGPFTLPDI
jgi:diguanylate cyclase (GGDEF)-like protein/PAS domain S-box-containing protein